MSKEREIETISLGKAMRTRLGMYLSSDLEEALYLGLREIYVNCFDALTETKTKNGKVLITINTKNHIVSVEDNGPGIPNKIREDGVHSVVAAYTLGHSGSHFKSQGTNAIGLNGIGAKVVNHTASFFNVRSNDGKSVYSAYFHGSDDGAILDDEQTDKPSGPRGVKIEYSPDPAVYEDVWFNEDKLQETLNEMMKFYPNIKLYLTFDGHMTEIYYPDGLREKNTKIYYESPNLILALNDDGTGIKPYGNRLYLPQGGNFMSHFKTQLTKLVNEYSGLKLKGEQIQRVFGGYVAVFVTSPLFSNQSKTALSNKEVNSEITSALREQLAEFVETPSWDKIIKGLEAEAKAEAAAERAREKVLKAKKDFAATKINAMSEKFIDTDSKKRLDCDLYLAEGDSAGGPIKRTKPNNAAVMLLRGKVLNVARTDFESVINNNELMMIAKGIGAELSNSGFVLRDKAMRFGKIIIASDSDEDGMHIQCLLMTFFYKYFPNLIKTGKLFILAPRLFEAKTKTKSFYFATEKEMKDYIKANKIRSYEVFRYKGLGGFDDKDFASQIDPETRSLIQVTINSAANAAKAMQLMEDNVAARKALIEGEWEWNE